MKLLHSIAAGAITIGAGRSTLSAQTPAPVLTAPCRANVDSLQHRIEMNYAGFTLEITGARQKQYADTLAALERAADRTAHTDCRPLLSALIDWYHDPHLFLYQADVTDTTEASRAKSAVARRDDIDEAKARAYLTKNRAHLDPIEGIWYDLGLRLAVVPVRNARDGRFEAVVLHPDTATWSQGEVRARFTRRADGSYDAAIWSATRTLKALHGEIYKRVMLRLSPGIWGKEFPVARTDSGVLNPVDPHRATLQFRGKSVVLSIPSHDPSFRFTLDSLIKNNDAALRAADYLIVDVRGNEGGSSWVTDGLLPFIASDPPRTSPYPPGKAMILSSPNQITYATRSFAGPKGVDSSPSLQRLLARMRANPGKLVPMSDSLDDETEKPITAVFGPKRVAIMIDRGTVSASEVLVLRGLESTRTIIIGQPTEGALDYQSTNIVYFSPLERRWGLGYPTITRSAALPLNGMRGVGIKPDMVVDWTKIENPVGYVERVLQRSK